MSLERLQEYDTLIKQEIADSVANKANVSHNHDDRYYTESQVDTKIDEVNAQIEEMQSQISPAKVSIQFEQTGQTSYLAYIAGQEFEDAVNSGAEVVLLWDGEEYALKSYNFDVSNSNGKPLIKAEFEKFDPLTMTVITITLDGLKENSNLRGVVTFTDVSAEEKINEFANEISSTYETKTDAQAKYDELNAKANESDVFVVNVIGNDTDGYTADKNTFEILDAHNSNKIVVAKSGAMRYRLNQATQVDNGSLVMHTLIFNAMRSATTNSIITMSYSSINGSTTVSRQEQVLLGSGENANLTTTDKTIVGAINEVHSELDSHTHTIADVTDLQSTLDSKASSGHGHDVATTSADGFMSAAMISKLNGIDEGANKTIVDSALSSTSTNPIQNKVITTAINDAVSAISTNTSSIESHTHSIATLQSELDSYEEITNEEIQALFSA